MKLKFLLIICLSFSLNLFAQDINGIAVYKSIIQNQSEVDSTKLNDKVYMELIEMLNNPPSSEYELNFTKQESIFTVIPKLEKPNPSKDNKGVSITVTLMDENEVLYKNLPEHLIINEKETFGKRFLIIDTLKNKDWKLENETKTIGNYICFKATYIKRIENSSNTKNGIRKEHIVTAWYTPQIPISNGPSEYDGLPGLILEVRDGEVSFLCTKIIINPNKSIKIKPPKRGEIVNREEYRLIINKKNEERLEFLMNKN